MSIILYFLAAAGMVLFVCPVVFMGIGVNFGNITGIILSGAAFAFAGHGSVLPSSFFGPMRWVVSLFLCLLGIGAVIGGAESVLMIRTLQNAPDPKEDLPVLVLGCGVEKGKPSTILKERLDTARQYLEAHPDSKVIVCGGKGEDELISEAECMAIYLKEHGIEADRICEEDQSANTRENLTNAAAILQEKHLGSRAMVVTSDFHCYRAKVLAQSSGLETYALPARTFRLFLPTYWIREWYGILAQGLSRFLRTDLEIRK